jgi:hypothetical protein
VKYTTFRALIIAAGGFVALAGLGTCVVCVATQPADVIGRETPAPVQPQLQPALPPSPMPAPVSPAPSVELGAESLPVTEMDRAILARAGQNISGDKQKDALPGRAYKVNLYKDAGQSRVNRLKIDLDRDDKWDEKWTLTGPGEAKRQIAPLDDENYTLEYRLEGERWRKKN